MNCVLALKAYSKGKHGGWKFGGNSKPSSSGKQFVRKNSEPFMNSFLKNSLIEKSLDSLSSEQFLCGDLGRDLSEMVSELAFLSVIVKLFTTFAN